MSSECPICGSTLERIHRKPLERMLSSFVSIRRYRCPNSECNWKGRFIEPKKRAKSGIKMEFKEWALVLLIAGVGLWYGLRSHSNPAPEPQPQLEQSSQ